MAKTGRCLCGAVTWAFTGAPTWACHCHCDDCRRNCAAPMVSYIGVPLAAFEWTGAKPAIYASSKGVQRHFCGTCGTPMAFQAEHYVGEIHVYAAGLDDPNDFKPTFHVYHAEKLPWLHLSDSLKRYDGNAPEDQSG